MDIVYKKDTLYVYIKDKIDSEFVELLELRVNRIMERYDIENLVIDVGNQNSKLLDSFCIRYNGKHKSKVLVR